MDGGVRACVYFVVVVVVVVLFASVRCFIKDSRCENHTL